MPSYMASPAGIRVNTVVLTFTLVAGLVVFLRLFTRIFLVRKAPCEDACVALAMVNSSPDPNLLNLPSAYHAEQALSIGLTVTIAVQVQNGLGQHIYELTEMEMVNSLKVGSKRS